MNDNNVLEIRNKKYGLLMVKMGYELIDLMPCSDGVHCIFAYSEEALNVFKQLIAENKKRSYMLSDLDVRTLVGYLEGYDISDNDRFRLLSVFDRVLNKMDAEPEVIYTDIPEDIQEVMIEDQVAEVDVSQLKDAMSGGNYEKYNKAFNKAVNK